MPAKARLPPTRPVLLTEHHPLAQSEPGQVAGLLLLAGQLRQQQEGLRVSALLLLPLLV